MNKIFKAITFGLITCGVTILSSSEKAAMAKSDYYYIQARHSGQCLNVLNGGQNNGDNVVQGEECNNPNFQWSIIPAGRNSNYIEARHSGQCLNVLNSGQNNGDNVVQGDECNTANFQWSIIPVRNFRPSNSRPWGSRNHDRDYKDLERDLEPGPAKLKIE